MDCFVANIYNEKQLREMICNNEVYWEYIAKYQKLSEGFIREFKNKLDLRIVAGYQELSEVFIDEFQNELDFDIISANQNLSEEFILKFQNKINWIELSMNDKIKVSDEFTMQFDEKLIHIEEDVDFLFKGCEDKFWLINNHYHRILGPARIWHNGNKEYWYRGKCVKVKNNKGYSNWLKQHWMYQEF